MYKSYVRIARSMHLSGVHACMPSLHGARTGCSGSRRAPPATCTCVLAGKRTAPASVGGYYYATGILPAVINNGSDVNNQQDGGSQQNTCQGRHGRGGLRTCVRMVCNGWCLLGLKHKKTVVQTRRAPQPHAHVNAVCALSMHAGVKRDGVWILRGGRTEGGGWVLKTATMVGWSN